MENLLKCIVKGEVVVCEVLSDTQGVFKRGELVVISEYFNDGVHYYSDGYREGYLSPNEVLEIKFKLTRI